jgi:hypothetical protein
MAETIKLPAASLKRIGLGIVTMIRERTLKGEGIDGPLAPYSTRPFARPLGGVPSRTLSALGGNLKRFTTKQGRLWAVIIGGYKAYKAARYPQDGGGVNMTAEGNMMRSLAVIAVDPATGKIVIGFNREESAEIAYYHNVSGAGKGRRLRKFMGLTPEEQLKVARLAGVEIQTNL